VGQGTGGRCAGCDGMAEMIKRLGKATSKRAVATKRGAASTRWLPRDQARAMPSILRSAYSLGRTLRALPPP
jgi:hypothetical protein